MWAQSDDLIQLLAGSRPKHPQPARRAAVMPANTAVPNHLLELNLARQSARESRSTVATCGASTPSTAAAVETAIG